MPDYRILGRDTTIRMTMGSQLLSEITAIQTANFKLGLTLLSEGFLGEPAKRHREVFDDVAVTFTLQPESNQVFQLQYNVYQRARVGQANPIVVNIQFRLQFANGTLVRLLVPDLQFDDVGGLNIPSREAFDTMAFSAKSNRYTPIGV